MVWLYFPGQAHFRQHCTAPTPALHVPTGALLVKLVDAMLDTRRRSAPPREPQGELSEHSIDLNGACFTRLSRRWRILLARLPPHSRNGLSFLPGNRHSRLTCRRHQRPSDATQKDLNTIPGRPPAKP